MLGRSVSRLNVARSQERLIGGKKAVTSLASSRASSSTSVATLASQHHQLQQQQIQKQMQQHIQLVQQQQIQQHQFPPNVYQNPQVCPQVQSLQPEILVIEKLKRGGAMKAQATQTDVKRNAQAAGQLVDQQLPDSPRPISRVREVPIINVSSIKIDNINKNIYPQLINCLDQIGFK